MNCQRCQTEITPPAPIFRVKSIDGPLDMWPVCADCATVARELMDGREGIGGLDVEKQVIS